MRRTAPSQKLSSTKTSGVQSTNWGSRRRTAKTAEQIINDNIKLLKQEIAFVREKLSDLQKDYKWFSVKEFIAVLEAESLGALKEDLKRKRDTEIDTIVLQEFSKISTSFFQNKSYLLALKQLDWADENPKKESLILREKHQEMYGQIREFNDFLKIFIDLIKNARKYEIEEGPVFNPQTHCMMTGHHPASDSEEEVMQKSPIQHAESYELFPNNTSKPSSHSSAESYFKNEKINNLSLQGIADSLLQK